MLQGGKDTYSYMWPRDASFSAMALDRAGDTNVAKDILNFAVRSFPKMDILCINIDQIFAWQFLASVDPRWKNSTSHSGG